LYRRRQGGLYRFALRMTGNPSVAEEVTQEVFMTLIREANRFDPSRGSLAAFLYGIGRNHILRCLERVRQYAATDDNPWETEASGRVAECASEEDPLTGLTRTETIERVRQAVLALPLNYREAVALCELEGMSYADSADALGCAVGTVRSRLHRGRALLLLNLGFSPG
jgi:RNA polymerase sigma-70 factor (ECF subfamily)